MIQKANLTLAQHSYSETLCGYEPWSHLSEDIVVRQFLSENQDVVHNTALRAPQEGKVKGARPRTYP